MRILLIFKKIKNTEYKDDVIAKGTCNLLQDSFVKFNILLINFLQNLILITPTGCTADCLWERFVELTLPAVNDLHQNLSYCSTGRKKMVHYHKCKYESVDF